MIEAFSNQELANIYTDEFRNSLGHLTPVEILKQFIITIEVKGINTPCNQL
ncbi:MAG: hypothetical protein QM478_11530 [Flavobacteriaceae bacterium]